MIITNLTDNRGCSDADYGKLCRAFLTCIKAHRVCIVSGDRVFGGSTAVDFSGKDGAISFAAISRVGDKARPELCFIATLGAAPGEEEPSWSYLVQDGRGAALADWQWGPKDRIESAAALLKKADEIVVVVLPRNVR